MRILISGASGLIGNALISSLKADGHEVVQLVRRDTKSATEIAWNPAKHQLDLSSSGKFDAVINLSGAGVGDKRWSDKYKTLILKSRVDSTTTIVKAIKSLPDKPKVLLNASAIGFYGERGSEEVDENSHRGTGFLSDVVQAWEDAALALQGSGVRVVLMRTGLVFTHRGGALAKLLPIFKLGLGGKLGSGKQYWSYISLEDEIRAIKFLLEKEVSGPVNLTAPNPATNLEVTKALGKALKRPTILAVPAFALKIALGEFSIEILGSSNVIPTKLHQAGFEWKHPTIEKVASTVI
ncbi:MAG: hypothetical protein RLZZ330_540 [Actinomycetota bacterium]|jgi:uncharacterized protein (TIGR01777 family)